MNRYVDFLYGLVDMLRDNFQICSHDLSYIYLMSFMLHFYCCDINLVVMFLVSSVDCL